MDTQYPCGPESAAQDVDLAGHNFRGTTNFFILRWLFREPNIYFFGRINSLFTGIGCQEGIRSLIFPPGQIRRGLERTIEMKRFTYAMVMAVALVVMVATFAVAGGPACKTAAKQAKMGECCIESAQASKGCCGQDADAVKAAYASYKEGCADKAACEAAVADMGKCCVAAVEAGKGCCGKEADVLKANFEQKVAYHKASVSVKADMHKCCAASLEAGKGCCGKDADALKADYDKKVETKTKKVASS